MVNFVYKDLLCSFFGALTAVTKEGRIKGCGLRRGIECKKKNCL